MLTVNLYCVGKLKEEYWRKASAEYEKRLSAFCRLQIIELPETRVPENPSPAQIEQVLQAEGKQFLAKLPEGGAVIPLCIEGKQLDSVQFSRLLEEIPLSGKSTVSFLIGGSHGLADAVKARGERKLSISPMTFPHQLARVMLLEQIYRAFQITAGGKYHK